ncbi:MAG: lipid A deacylase LpxR family protein [Guyparkeria sp.]|uniref:lipid A deacylase LpxR family protein n=1 Tax=Guyparkeria sp. TaxID=2035736 RepID=UPI00397DEE82
MQDETTAMTVTRHRYAPLLALGLLALASPAAAEGLLSVKSENDAWVGAGDGHYTNGAEISWAFAPDPDHWSRRMTDVIPGWHHDDVDGVTYRVGQRMYTPDDITIAELQEDDRPYAGVLATGLSLHGEQRNDGWRETRSLHLDAGMVGPASGAGWIQRYFHKNVTGDGAEGWSHQLENEPFLNLGYEHAWSRRASWRSHELEYGPSAGLALGNLHTYASAGLAARYGDGLDRSYGIPSIDPAQGERSFFRPGQGLGWYVFGALEGRYMAHNLLLDGNTWHDSHSVEREPWVGDVQLGFAVNWDRFQFAYTVVWRTKEFSTQNHNDHFGSFTLSMWM